MALNWQATTFLITGGTGSFGKAFINFLLTKHRPKVIRVFSRDEFKQYQMQQEFSRYPQLRFMLGDVREYGRLKRAMQGVDVVVHAAALKQITLGEYNPFEPIKTNINGTRNVIEAALDTGVKRVLLISSDKAAYPVNLYGATKLCAEKLFIQSNVYAGKKQGIFSVVRYGNVLGSRGSVIPMFYDQKQTGVLTITDPEMSRFWITLPQACKLVQFCLSSMRGGEIFIPKLPSVKVIDLAKAIAPQAKLKVVGIRPGEKLHEVLITEEESRHVIKKPHCFLIEPQFPFWQDKNKRQVRKRQPFVYSSDKNSLWLSKTQIEKMLSGLVNGA